MGSLERHKKEIVSRVKAAKQIALMFDFDGVLSPVVRDYRNAVMLQRTKELLKACSQKFFVAVISGRALTDVQKRVGVQGIVYAGNHGLEWKIGDQKFYAPISETSRMVLRAARKNVATLTQEFPGLLLEDKGLTFSVHYSILPPRKRSAALAAALRVLRPSIESGALIIVKGHMALNILPKARWNKGSVARRMLLNKGGALPIFIGDDLTDEDAFRALHEGITIRVGYTKNSAAHYYVSSRKDVDTFLSTLLSLKRKT